MEAATALRENPATGHGQEVAFHLARKSPAILASCPESALIYLTALDISSLA